MKPYGHTRFDKFECKSGCCTMKGGKEKDCRKVVDKTRRKRARRFRCEAAEPE
jgi:hypothetical protein